MLVPKVTVTVMRVLRSEAVPCQGAGLAQLAGLKRHLLGLEQLSCAEEARRAIWRGRRWQGLVLRLPRNHCHLVRHDPPCVCPAQDPAPDKPASLRPFQRGCAALHSRGFQGMTCTSQGMQLARRWVRGSCFKRAQLGARLELARSQIPPPRTPAF